MPEAVHVRETKLRAHTKRNALGGEADDRSANGSKLGQCNNWVPLRTEEI